MLKDEILRVLREQGDYCSGQELCGRFGVTRTAVWKAVAKLKDEGYRIEAKQNRGYLLIPEGDIMNETELKDALRAVPFIRDCFYYDVTDSTNLEAKRAAEQGGQGPLLFVADRQTAGRGRRGRSWDSPSGTSISMSMLLRPEIRTENASMITLICALAVTAGIRDVTGLETGIKWPNDAVIGGKKICGILTEMATELGEINYVVPGIGINVNTESFPEEIAATATSLKIAMGGQTVRRVPVIAAVTKRFAEFYGIFLKTQDLSGLKEPYERMLVNLNRTVRVLDPAGEYSGTAEGINFEGELLVRREDGTLTAVRSGEVSVRGVYGYV